MKKYAPRAALLIADNAREKLGYYHREMQTLLRRADLVSASLKQIPSGDYAQLALFLEWDEILAERARLQNFFANANSQLEVAEKMAREDSITIEEEK